MTRIATVRSLLALPAFALLMACPPEEPPMVDPVPSVRLQSGPWSLEILEASSEGRCGDIELRELVGTRIGGELKVERDQVVFDLEGVVLRGRVDDRWLDLAGTYEDMVVYEESEESEPGYGGGSTGGGVDEPEEGDDDAAPPPPCETAEPEEEPRPSGEGEELWVQLYGEVVDTERMVGTLVVEYDMADLRCTVVAEVKGRYGEHGGAEPHADEPDETRPVEDDGDSIGDEDDRG